MNLRGSRRIQDDGRNVSVLRCSTNFATRSGTCVSLAFKPHFSKIATSGSHTDTSYRRRRRTGSGACVRVTKSRISASHARLSHPSNAVTSKRCTSVQSAVAGLMEDEVAYVTLDGPRVHGGLRPRRQVSARTRGCERARRETDEQVTHIFPESAIVLRIGSSFGPDEGR